MKTKIVIGCIIAVCVLLIVPSIPAVEISTIKEINRTQILTDLKSIDLQEFKERLQTINKKELKQKIFGALSDHKDRFNIDLGLIGNILNFIIEYLFAWIEFIVYWIIAIPLIILFFIEIVVYTILDSLGLIPHYKI